MSGTIGSVILHLNGPATGTVLPVCDKRCALPVRAVLGRMVELVEDTDSDDRDDCSHCAWCARLITNARGGSGCFWHQDACPPVEWAATIFATDIVHTWGAVMTDAALHQVTTSIAASKRIRGAVDPLAVLAHLRKNVKDPSP